MMAIEGDLKMACTPELFKSRLRRLCDVLRDTQINKQCDQVMQSSQQGNAAGLEKELTQVFQDICKKAQETKSAQAWHVMEQLIALVNNQQISGQLAAVKAMTEGEVKQKALKDLFLNQQVIEFCASRLAQRGHTKAGNTISSLQTSVKRSGETLAEILKTAVDQNRHTDEGRLFLYICDLISLLLIEPILNRFGIDLNQEKSPARSHGDRDSSTSAGGHEVINQPDGKRIFTGRPKPS